MIKVSVKNKGVINANEILGWGFNLYEEKPSIPVIIVKTVDHDELRVEICEDNAHLFPCEYAKHGATGKHHQNEIWDEKLNKFVPKTESNCSNH